MAKTLANYDPLVQIPSGMTPAGADFPIVESHDILVGENDKRLDAKLDDIDSAIGNVGQTPIATQLSSKVNTGDIVTSVAATGSTSNNKIPSETAVRAAIEAKTINVDSTVTQGSTNAVSGGAVHTQLATKQDVLTFDTTPTASSSNPVTSGGVKSALDTKQDALTFDTTPTASSSNPVTSGGVKAALDTKQNTLTYETTPIVGSVNPVTSTGIRNAIDTAAAQNLGAMQAQYAEFVADADAVLDRASSLSNGMVACSDISAETTVGDTRILLYTGTTNANYTNGHWYYNSAPSDALPSWTDGGAVGSAPTIDNTLTVEGAAANSKAVGDAIENIVTISNTQPGSNSGNKVWIRETTNEEVQVPTYAEHIAKANKADIATNNESDNGSGTISASKAYAIGDHFYINNTNTSSENYGVSTLYKATAAIASGDAIVVGTNCEASKVADEITSLSNDLDDSVNDLNSALSDVENEVYVVEPIDIYKYPTVDIGISTYNIWSSNGYSKFIPASVFPIKHISVKSNADRGSVICFLKTNNYAVGTQVVYATGTGRTFIQADQVMEFDIPDDCNYINILDHWPDDYLPQCIKMPKSKIDKIESQIMSDDKIGLTIETGWIDSACVISTHYNKSGNMQGIIDTNSTYNLSASPFIPVQGKMLQIPILWTMNTTFPNFGMSLYDADFNPVKGRAISAYPNRGENDPYVLWVNIYLPENVKYFRTTYWSAAMREEHPEDIPVFTYNLLKEIPDAYKPITHEWPVDTFMQNAIRRARQLTDIKWTPRVKIPRYSMLNGGSDHFLDWFYPDKEYIGIPYSGAGKGEGSASGWTAPEEWGYAHKWVGGCIPFESFITAARYPNSVFSETVDQQAPDYDSSPFGIVCTGLVNYTVNGPWPLRSIKNFFNTSDEVFRTPSSNNTISVIDRNEIMIGDFLYTKPHVIVITDILRDAEGNVTHVEMSEATTVGNGNNTVLGTQFGGVARRKMWEYSEFKRLYGNYVKYRRTTFYGIPYVPSKYVDTGNEGNRENIQDLPCIPYLGNGAIYREGYIHNSKILIGATGFTSLVVTKDGESFGTFDVTGQTEISIGFSAVGSYEAYLTSGTTRTMSCNWTVESGTM